MIRHFRKFLILLSFIGCISKSNGQLNKKDVVDAAKMHCESLINQNWDGYRKHIPPKLFELMGGSENAKKLITTQWKDDNKKGIRLNKVVIDSCTNVTKYKDEYQSTLLASFEYQTDSTIITIQSTLIAFTSDNGLHWYYLDTYSMPIDKVYAYFPNISKELVLFKKGNPSITKKR